MLPAPLPATVLLPSPVAMENLSAAMAEIKLLPPPTEIATVPVPPISVLLPLPPISESLPAPAAMLSWPLLPTRTALPTALSVSVASAVPPRNSA